jgi:hypothetical protein
VTPEQRWAELKADLIRRIDADVVVFESFRDAGALAEAAPLGGLLSANRSTLAKMRELEADR